MSTGTFFCECDSQDCIKNIWLSYDEAIKVLQGDLIIIIDDCPHGASDGDQLVEQRNGYSLYRR